MAAENQHKSVRLARDRLAAIADKHALMISHGKGPQVGPLAWQESEIEFRLINRSRRGFRSPRLIHAGSKPEAGTLPAERRRTFKPYGGQHAARSAAGAIGIDHGPALATRHVAGHEDPTGNDMFCEVMRERAGGPRNHGCTGMTEFSWR
jgi:hypothetical protein